MIKGAVKIFVIYFLIMAAIGFAGTGIWYTFFAGPDSCYADLTAHRLSEGENVMPNDPTALYDFLTKLSQIEDTWKVTVNRPYAGEILIRHHSSVRVIVIIASNSGYRLAVVQSSLSRIGDFKDADSLVKFIKGLDLPF